MSDLPSENNSDSFEAKPAVSGGTTASIGNSQPSLLSSRDLDFSSSDQKKTVISRRPIAPPAEFMHSMPLAELARLLEGKNLDHFHVEQMIGGGGMGAVFRGTDLRLDRTVAIKVVPTANRDPDTFRRFRMEAQSAARLDHPNIARVYYIGESEKWNYIVFEYIDGINLRDLVEMEGPLSIDDAVFYTRQVADALQHAQQRDVVHRDIKPSNVLITPAGTVKVVDMGLARSTAMERSSGDMTASGVTLGTFDYISPEQARNPRDADVRSDLYSLGCTLFYMLSGRPPFPEGTALQKLLNHGSQAPPDLRQFRDDLSDELYAVLMKLMSKRPLDRYQKPSDLINDLLLVAEAEDLVRSQTPGAFLISATPAERSLIEANAPWMVALAFLLGIALWQNVEINGANFDLPQPQFSSRAATTEISRAETNVQEPNQLNNSVVTSALPNSIIQEPSTQADTISAFASGTDHGEPATELPTNQVSAATLPIAPTEIDSSTNLIMPEVNANQSVAEPLGPTDPTGLTVPPDTLVVLAGAHELSAGAQWCRSLADAISRAEANPSIRFIELHNDQLIRERILISRHGLTIRVPPDKKAEITFAPNSFFAEDDIERMLDVGSNDLRLENLSIVATIPVEAVTRRSAIIGLEPAGQIELINCRLTFVDPTEVGENRAITIDAPGHQPVAFDFSDFSTHPTGPAVDLRVADPASIKFRNCWARGEMALVGMDGGFRVELSAQQLFLSVAEQMFIVDATDAETSPLLRISLKESTLACARGLFRIRLNSEIVTECLNRTAQSCVFWSREPNCHISFEGLSEVGSADELILLKGEDNAYEHGETGLVQIRTLQGETKRLDVSDGLSPWFRERGNDYLVRWLNPFPPTAPFHEQTPADYQLKESMFMPGFWTSAQ